MRFHICAQTDRWDEAYELGKGCLFIEPDGLNGPVLLAHALHKLGRSQEAYATLRPVCDAFPGESGPPYNLACICCALGQVEEAREWLAKALEIGGKELILQALDDEESVAVW
jgi:tetratricopeptide (TPR) repeat protein